MFTAAPFTTAMTWKRPKCSSAEEWMKTMWHIYTVEYYSDLKGNRGGPLAETWMVQELSILSEVRQRKTNIIQHHLYKEYF